MRALLLSSLVVLNLFLLAQPASACSCPSWSVTERVEESSAVYIAEPRWPDLLPGRSFRVVETLKGPLRHNLRVDVDTPLTGTSCSTRVRSQPYVLTLSTRFPEDGFFLNLCTEVMGGDDAVVEARRVLGEGTRMGWQPDLRWSAQWAMISLIPVAGIAWGVWWARRERRHIVDNP